MPFTTKNQAFNLRQVLAQNLTIQNSLSTSKVPNRRNVVVRKAIDFNSGTELGFFFQPHDGTMEGILAAAKIVTDRMFNSYPNASEMRSVMLATDKKGAPRWKVSPNFKHIIEVGAPDEFFQPRLPS